LIKKYIYNKKKSKKVNLVNITIKNILNGSRMCSKCKIIMLQNNILELNQCKMRLITCKIKKKIIILKKSWKIRYYLKI